MDCPQHQHCRACTVHNRSARYQTSQFRSTCCHRRVTLPRLSSTIATGASSRNTTHIRGPHSSRNRRVSVHGKRDRTVSIHAESALSSNSAPPPCVPSSVVDNASVLGPLSRQTRRTRRSYPGRTLTKPCSTPSMKSYPRSAVTTITVGGSNAGW